MSFDLNAPNPAVLKVAIAGLLHDCGKFAGPGVLDVSEPFDRENSHIYQPKNASGTAIHLHALHTAAFLQDPRVRKFFPSRLFEPGWGGPDTLLELAARHHKPETPLQQIITEADRLASGWEREGFAELSRRMSPQDYLRTRLEPLLEHLGSHTGSQRKEHEFFYPLKELGPDSLFPIFSTGSTYNTGPTSRQEYKELFEHFVSHLGRLSHQATNVPLWFENLDSLFARYTVNIPADRAGLTTPDVSLYDHSRTVAALASALYLFHTSTDSLDLQSIKENDEETFLLISGQFYNIYDYLFLNYGDAGNSGSRLLLGRSLAVALFSELASDLICRLMGLPHTSVLKSVGGHFFILAPNTSEAKEALAFAEEHINNWLINSYYCDKAVSITYARARPSDLVKGKFKPLFVRLSEKAAAKKLSFKGYGAIGNTGQQDTKGQRLCRICAQRPVTTIKSGEAGTDNLGEEAFFTCGFCRDHIYLGTDSVRKRRIAVFDRAVSSEIFNKMAEPIFGRYQILFFSGTANEFSEKRGLLRTWDLEFDRGTAGNYELATKSMCGHVPISDHPESDKRVVRGFGEIARAGVSEEEQDPSPFRPALATLRFDIDDTSALLCSGLPDRQFTISRLTHLSRHINSYFSLYLQHSLRSTIHFRELFTVYSGGDDLFLIGPSKAIFDFANLIKKTFRDFACQNPSIHASGAITVQKEGASLEDLAEESLRGLQKAKSEPGKNSINVLGRNLSWDGFEVATKLGGDLAARVIDGRIPEEVFEAVKEMASREEPPEVVRDYLEKNMRFNEDSRSSDLRWLKVAFKKIEKHLASATAIAEVHIAFTGS